MKSTKTSDWNNCYDDGWKGIITDAAFAHPAKFAHGLIRRIYQHALAAGHVQPGAVVLDPFGGVALGALYAMQNGLAWVGCELEEKFVALGRENIALWNARYADSLPAWGSATLLQGDSRRLAEVVRGAGLVVSSPPFQASLSSGKFSDDAIEQLRQNGHRPGPAGNAASYGSTPGQLAALPAGDVAAVIGSPPFQESLSADNVTAGRKELAKRLGVSVDKVSPVEMERIGKRNQDYGDSAGQLGAMKPGDIAAVIGSPPFAGSVGSDDPQKRGGLLASDPRRAGDVNLTGSYGVTPGQLAGMVVGSPPFMGQTPGSNKPAYETRPDGSPFGAGRSMQSDYDEKVPFEKRGFLMGKEEYTEWGKTCNLGSITSSQETFWHAAAEIMAQCALLLPPGGYAYWVVKAYVKKGEIVDFPGQWAALAEAYGFEVVETVRAWLVKDHGTQADLFGNGHKKSVARKSFFRRLAEAKGSPAIDWETVLITRRRND